MNKVGGKTAATDRGPDRAQKKPRRTSMKRRRPRAVNIASLLRILSIGALYSTPVRGKAEISVHPGDREVNLYRRLSLSKPAYHMALFPGMRKVTCI